MLSYLRPKGRILGTVNTPVPRSLHWRSLEDTAVAAQLLYVAADEYSEYRRSVDYLSRGLAHLARSRRADPPLQPRSEILERLLPFIARWLGHRTRSEVILLRRLDHGSQPLAANDRAGFFQTRLRSTDTHAPLGGINGGGWKPVCNGTAQVGLTLAVEDLHARLPTPASTSTP